MADGKIPASLKLPEISRLLNRANQLRSFKPAIAYWCEYHAVNQIVAKNLHILDDVCFGFTKTLLERLETVKAERADDDAIVDNTVGRAYVEQFAQETFERAERTLRANKVTRQTADTFDAAATFFHLTNAWGAPEPDVAQKIKFAKWNAARILKALREGKDPNESNPVLGDVDVEQPMDLDLQDAAPQEVTTSDPPGAVYVEDVPDAGEPDPISAAAALGPPPPLLSMALTEPVVPAPNPPEITPQFMPPPPTEEKPFAPISIPAAHLHPPPSLPVATPPVTASSPFAPPPPQAHAQAQNAGPFKNDQKSINQAQKHAKWAISALNFEDVPTAVQELRNALATLGAL